MQVFYSCINKLWQYSLITSQSIGWNFRLHYWFSAQSITRLKSKCWSGWLLIWKLWEKIHLRAHSYWNDSFSCSRKFPVSLLTVNQGHSQIPEVTVFLSMCDLHLQIRGSASSTSCTLYLWIPFSLPFRCTLKGQVWLGQAHLDILIINSKLTN